MNSQLSHGDLRALVLKKALIQSIKPGDCKNISREISRTVNRTVSETTLKRFFGFADAGSGFSKFTLTALIEFVQADRSEHIGLADISHHAAEVTALTLKGMMNRSGIPFNHTVPRSFVMNHMTNFLNSDACFGCLIGGHGTGKTIAMAHLVQQLAKPQHKENAILYIKAFNLFSEKHGCDLESLLKFQLKISQEVCLIDYFEHHAKNNNKQLVVLIDNFAALPSIRLKDCLKAVADFVSKLGNGSGIKIFINLRTENWKALCNFMIENDHFRQKWFPSPGQSIAEPENMLPFSPDELESILSNCGITQVTDHALLKQISFPAYMQSFYRLVNDGHENVTADQLIHIFVKDKVYYSNYFTEKLTLLKRLIAFTKNSNRVAIPKRTLESEVGPFRNAYSELLSDGIIEEKLDLRRPAETLVRFSQQYLRDYFNRLTCA